jgi:trehalose 6-phosphate phosphatase
MSSSVTPSAAAAAPVATVTAALSPPPRHWRANAPWALFLDLDGTLCEFVDDPFAVTLSVAQKRLLHDLHARLQGALCVLSGRGANDLARVLGDVPVLRVGDHGRDSETALAPAVLRQLDAAEMVMRKLACDRTGVWVERKPASCALHYRQAPQCETQLIVAVRLAVDAMPGLRLLEGHRVLEVTSPAGNKGAALRRVMQSAPFADRCPVAVGDDVTDEDAFIAAAALGGFGVAVGARPSVAARHGLSDCTAVDAWLQELAYGLPEPDDA